MPLDPLLLPLVELPVDILDRMAAALDRVVATVCCWPLLLVPEERPAVDPLAGGMDELLGLMP